MSSLKKDEQLRREGMSYALRVAKENGVEGLENELHRRNASEVPLRITKAQMQQYSESVKENVVNHILLLSLVTLRDEFEFGAKRLKQFQERFTDKASCIAGDWTTWEEQVKVLAEEVGIEYVEYMKDVTVRV
ncbi:hypothetical protein DW996_12435 [Roseburia sp. AM51-8]|jgi:hypothetical protein|uniref:hypothetical protein n=1 Tax=Roseburia sp. AM51-8 TaxID=2292366 RepID=UPI000E4CDB1B|nr:hypothetical protein [Roseburia sp. AM51-8]RHP98979.1 hypothetical protein DW996_12435 [Roseburia sp. AM51-8]